MASRPELWPSKMIDEAKTFCFMLRGRDSASPALNAQRKLCQEAVEHRIWRALFMCTF